MTQLRRPHTARRLRARVPAVLTVLTPGSDHGARARRAGPGTPSWSRRFPGGGWIQSIDNTAGGSVAAGPVHRAGRPWGTALSSSPSAATTDFAGVAHPFFPVGDPLCRSDRRELANVRERRYRHSVRRGSLAEVLRLPGRISRSMLHNPVVELVFNGGATPDVWQDNALSDRDTRLADHRQRGWVLPPDSNVLHVRRFQGGVPGRAILCGPGCHRHRGSGGDELGRWRVADHRGRGGRRRDVRLRRCRGSDPHPHRRSV